MYITSKMIDDIISLCIDKSYHILALIEIGKTSNDDNKPKLTKITKLNTNNDKEQTYYIYTYNQSYNYNEGIGIILNEHLAKHVQSPLSTANLDIANNMI
jgi:hypothetical protein